MADLIYTLNQWFASYAHPMWVKTAGVNANATTTEAVQKDLDGGVFGTDYGHAWNAGDTYALDAVVEYGAPVGHAWRSLQNGNQGNTPNSSPSWWEAVDDGLGADDADWITITGMGRPTRHNHTTNQCIHFYSHPTLPVSAMRWTTQYTGGQWAMQSGGNAMLPAVRMAPDSDTCYFASFAVGQDEGGDYITGTLYRAISGTVTELGTASVYMTRGSNQTGMIYAYGSYVGLAYGTAEASALTHPTYILAPVSEEILLEVVDSTIPEAGHEYVGVRATLSGTNSTHELYGGSFIPPPDVAAPVTQSNRASGVYPQGTTITLSEAGTDESQPVAIYYRWDAASYALYTAPLEMQSGVLWIYGVDAALNAETPHSYTYTEAWSETFQGGVVAGGNPFNLFVVVVDAGTGVSAAGLQVGVRVGDTASGTETPTEQATARVTESGHAVEGLTEIAAATLADSFTGVDVVGVTNPASTFLVVLDTGFSSDAVSYELTGIEVFKLVVDAVVGRDRCISPDWERIMGKYNFKDEGKVRFFAGRRITLTAEES